MLAVVLVVLGAANPARAACDGSQFLAPVSYAAANANHLRDMTVADVTGDGKPDIIATDETVGQISVLKNNGDGTYAARVTFATATGPVGVATGDVNSDGKLDIVVACFDAGKVSVFLNQSSGGSVAFAAKADYTAGPRPFRVAVGDVTGDGKLDLATANETTLTVSVLKNNGDGTFAAKVDLASGGSNVESVAIGDVTGDGKADLITNTMAENMVGVYVNQTSGGSVAFAARVTYPAGNTPRTARIGDVTGDGKADVVVGAQLDDKLGVLVNQGSGTFAAKVDYTTGTWPIGIALGDLTGDGMLDAASANFNSNTASVFVNQGGGTFAAKVDYATGTNPVSVAISDVNADGLADLVYANYAAGTASVRLNGCAVADPCSPNPCATPPANGCYNAGTGTCSTVNGAAVCDFSPLAKPNGTLCDDGSVATYDDSCTAGTCAGTDALPALMAGGYTVSVPDDGVPNNQPEILEAHMLSNAQLAALATLPNGVSFPNGGIGFTVVGVPVGGTITVTVQTPAVGPTQRLLKYTPTNGWMDVTGTFHVTHLSGLDSFAITLQDGGFGDADGVANGRIQDPLGWANDSTPIPTLGEWAVILLLLAMAAVAVTRLRRTDVLG